MFSKMLTKIALTATVAYTAFKYFIIPVGHIINNYVFGPQHEKSLFDHTFTDFSSGFLALIAVTCVACCVWGIAEPRYRDWKVEEQRTMRKDEDLEKAILTRAD